MPMAKPRIVPLRIDTSFVVPIPVPVPGQSAGRVVLGGDIPSPANPPKGCKFNTRCPHATDLCRTLLDEGVPGIHFYTMNQSVLALELCRRLGHTAGPAAG